MIDLMAHVGEEPSPLDDLGMRLAHRRVELGLGVEEVARRAGLDETYVEYLEGNGGTGASSAAVRRLAKALDTTPVFLAGGDLQRPPGAGRAGPHPIVEVMSRSGCEACLRPGGVGRVVFVLERGPVALPVNFRFNDNSVVFRTAPNAAITRCFDSVVGFEVDRVDEETSEGWSVVITGKAARVDAIDRADYVRLGIEPWAGGYRDIFVRIAVGEMSGRRIRQGA